MPRAGGRRGVRAAGRHDMTTDSTILHGLVGCAAVYPGGDVGTEASALVGIDIREHDGIGLVRIVEIEEILTQLYAQHKMNVKRDLVSDMEWELERTDED